MTITTLVEPTRLLPFERPINAILSRDSEEFSGEEWLSRSYTRVRERDAYESLDPQKTCPCNCADQPEDEGDHFCLHSFVEPLWILVAGMREGLIVFICEFCRMHEGEHGTV